MTTSRCSVMAPRYQRRVEFVNSLSRNSTRCKVPVVTTADQPDLSGPAHRTPVRRRPRTSHLTTAERLLEHRPLAEISVDDLAKGAGISRPTFYFYFPSKDAVLLTLLERVIVEADSALEALVANPPDRSSRVCGGSASTSSSRRSGRTRRSPRPIRRPGTNAEVRDCGRRFMQKWIAISPRSSRPSAPAARRR